MECQENDRVDLEVIENILESEEPFYKSTDHVFSSLIPAAFEKITLLRDKGFSFVQICDAFVEAGFLPKNTNPKYFTQAFRREKERQKKMDKLLGMVKSGGKPPKKEEELIASPTKKANSAATNSNKVAQNKGGEAEKTDQEKERVRKMTGTVVDTGLGKIIKHTDGSFEF